MVRRTRRWSVWAGIAVLLILLSMLPTGWNSPLAWAMPQHDVKRFTVPTRTPVPSTDEPDDPDDPDDPVDPGGSEPLPANTATPQPATVAATSTPVKTLVTPLETPSLTPTYTPAATVTITLGPTMTAVPGQDTGTPMSTTLSEDTPMVEEQPRENLSAATLSPTEPSDLEVSALADPTATPFFPDNETHSSGGQTKALGFSAPFILGGIGLLIIGVVVLVIWQQLRMPLSSAL